MGVDKNMLFRIVWGILCFFLSGVCAFVVLMNIVVIGDEGIALNFQMTTSAAIKLSFFAVATAFFLWRGIRWIRPPKKEKPPVELLGEEF